jgi:purine nucleosidase
MPRKIIIDTDPGQDDAVAILLALASPELEVLGITAVAGNVPLALTQANARRIVELAGRAVPVMAGCDRPMARPLRTAEHVHGKTGLNGAELPEPALPLDPRHAVDFLIETLRREAPGTVTLCPLGPLTNIATAFRRAPDIVDRVEEIVLMGGGFFEGGNITPAAESTSTWTPRPRHRSALRPLRHDHPARLHPRGPHHPLPGRPLPRHGNPGGRGSRGWLDFFERFDVQKYGSEGGPPPRPLA